MSRPFAANFTGRCAADCGEPIEVDDQVRYVDDELVHDDCDSVDVAPKDRMPAVCSKCWTAHAGECL